MWGDILLAKMVAVVTVKDDKGVSSEAMRVQFGEYATHLLTSTRYAAQEGRRRRYMDKHVSKCEAVGQMGERCAPHACAHLLIKPRHRGVVRVACLTHHRRLHGCVRRRVHLARVAGTAGELATARGVVSMRRHPQS